MRTYICTYISMALREIQGFDDVAAVNDKRNQLIAYYFEKHVCGGV